MINFIPKWIKYFLSKDKKLLRKIYNITGFLPKNLAIYKLSLTHSSASSLSESGQRHNNERLEFLGDTVLDLIIGEFIFKKYPTKDEGFLTETKSKIVNREQLTRLARKIGLHEMLISEVSNEQKKQAFKHIYGNTFEAFIGAIYLDMGYKTTYDFVVNRIITQFVNMETLIAHSSNYKSMLLEWAQSKNISIEYRKATEIEENQQFSVEVFVDGDKMGIGSFFKKKQAEQNAAFEACKRLKIIDT